MWTAFASVGVNEALEHFRMPASAGRFAMLTKKTIRNMRKFTASILPERTPREAEPPGQKRQAT